MMNTTTPPLLLTPDSITVIIASQEYTVVRSHPNFELVKEAVKAQDWDKIPQLMNLKKAVELWSNSLFRIEEDQVFYLQDRLPELLESRVLAFFREGLPVEPLLNFWARLNANPSKRAVDELYKFLEYKNIPIGADGFIFAYKAIREDWKDIYSGTIDNSLGRVVTMARAKVDDDAQRGCSAGLHVGAMEYVSSYGASTPGRRVIIVKIDPADVVSIPYDHSFQKMRCCRYEVVEEYTGLLPETLYRSNTEDYDYPADDSAYDDAWWDEEEDADIWRDEVPETYAVL